MNCLRSYVIIHLMDDSQIPKTFTEKVEYILTRIPCGKVTSYGTVAALAGSPRAARQVVQILHRTDDIPWHRVVNSKYEIAIKDPSGFQEQKMLLAMEDIETDINGKIDKEKHRWNIHSIDEIL